MGIRMNEARLEELKRLLKTENNFKMLKLVFKISHKFKQMNLYEI